MANENPIYQEKLSRFNLCLNSTLDGTAPDRVPIYTTADVWVPRNAGLTFTETYVNDLPSMKKALKWFNDNVYTDVHWSNGLVHPFPVLNLFNGGLYVFNDEGYQITGGESQVMTAEEYPQFIADSQGFTANVLLPRKYKVFETLNEDEAADLLANSIKAFLGWSHQSGEVTQYAEEELGLPLVTKGVALMPLDYVLDALRDFKGTFTDLRRQPENVLKALEVIYPQMLAMPLGMGARPHDESGIVFIPMHIPTFLNKKQFERFYLPYMKRMTADFNNMGFRLVFFCEDEWTPYMELLQELPIGNNGYIFEKGDPVYLKHMISGKGCFIGGMTTELLKTGTKEQCVDRAKWCLDELAPDGKYIFSMTKTLVNKNDSSVENFAAVCEYVRDNGKY